MSNNQSVIKVEQLTMEYIDGQRQVSVLSDLNLSVDSGEMLAIIGQSGSGKSTLLHLIGALDNPTSGTVEVMGRDIHKMSPKQQGLFRSKHLGFVYQFHHLLAEFTALENVAMPLLIAGQSAIVAKTKAASLIDAVGLSDRSEHKPGELSGGEKQRISLARALVTEPSCVLADEPTGNLDKQTAEKTLQLMLELNQKLSTSFIVVTHDQQMAERMDRILILDKGRLAPQG